MNRSMEKYQHLFPDEGYLAADGSISGLPKNSKPKNCKIIDSFKKNHKSGNYEFFLLEESNGNGLIIRISKASESSNYEEYCVLCYEESSNESILSIFKNILKYL